MTTITHNCGHAATYTDADLDPVAFVDRWCVGEPMTTAQVIRSLEAMPCETCRREQADEVFVAFFGEVPAE